MREISIPRGPYDIGNKVYDKSKMQIEEGLTVVVGCNGCGKTTFFRLLKEQLKKAEDDIAVVNFNCYQDGGKEAMSRYDFYGDMDFLATAMVSSEGERIMLSLLDVARECARVRRSGKKEIWVLVDAVDSGLSVDNVVEIKQDLFGAMMEDMDDVALYIVVTANEYEMARGENCFDVVSGKYIRFKDYEQYREFILNSRKKKDKRDGR